MKKLICLTLIALSANAWAQTTVNVENAWVRGTVAAQKATGAFMQITASSNARLVQAHSSVAAVVEIHEMAMQGDVMKMRAIKNLALPAAQTVELKPGGHHIMLMELNQQLKTGQKVSMTLVFEDEKNQRFEQKIELPVAALGATKDGMKQQSSHSH